MRPEYECYDMDMTKDHCFLHTILWCSVDKLQSFDKKQDIERQELYVKWIVHAYMELCLR